MGVLENRLSAALVELDMDQGAFALLAGLNRTKFSQGLRGIAPFTGPEQIKLAALVEELRELARNAAPLKLSFRDVEATRRLLEHKREGIDWQTVAAAQPGEAEEQHEQR